MLYVQQIPEHYLGIRFRLRADSGGGIITVRADDVHGPRLCTLIVPHTRAVEDGVALWQVHWHYNC
jgi:hypothetical protein